MLKKLTSLVTNNFWLKVFAAVLAVILWMVIVNVEDPDKTTAFSVTVDVINADYLSDMGKTYEILDNSENISFTVTGKRSIVENLTASDFKAVANMENIDDTMTMVPIVITSASYGSQLEITKASSYLLVNVENVISKDFDIDVETSGVTAAGCYVESLSASPESVSISGPESVMEQISSAQVTISLDGSDEAISSDEDIVLLDDSGNEVSQDRLTMDNDTALATADILLRKTIGMSFEVSGEPADGYRSGDVTSDIKAITLEGDWDVLNPMTSLEISSPLLNIEGAEDTVSAIIHLPDYLPDGVKIMSGGAKDVTVTIEIEAQTVEEFDMPVSNITVSGLADGLSLSYNSDTVTVLITGYEEDLSSVNANRLSASIDASGLQTGTYNVPVVIDGDYGSSAEATASVTVTKSEN